MAEFINTVDVIGDEALTSSIIDKSITEYKDDSVTNIGRYAFYKCSNLTSVDLPSTTRIFFDAFEACGKLRSVNLPLATSIEMYAFSNCSSLIALILRNTSKVCTLSNTNAFRSTPIASGTGYIYVPRDLVDSYKAATNWSTYATQFRALEDYTVDRTTTGELDPNKI